MSWFTDRIKSFGYAIRGVKIGWRQPHIRVHFFAVLLVVALGFILKVSYLEWLVLILCFAMVIAAELFNTAVETLSDRVTKEQDPLIGQTKDLAAGAVLITSIGAAIIGVFIFLNNVW